MAWDQFKKGFDAWEGRTAQLLEQWLKSASVLQPMGTLLTAAMKVKAARDRAVAQWWAGMGLATRRDQERALHTLTPVNARLVDLEERLEERQEGR